MNRQTREEQKRNLIDSIEALRSGTSSDVTAVQPQLSDTDSELKRLREQLRLANNTIAMLQEEMGRIEQQALSAIAESGELRRQLELSVQPKRSDKEIDLELLTSALSDSESEIARLMRNLTLLTKRFA